MPWWSSPWWARGLVGAGQVSCAAGCRRSGWLSRWSSWLSTGGRGGTCSTSWLGPAARSRWLPHGGWCWRRSAVTWRRRRSAPWSSCCPAWYAWRSRWRCGGSRPGSCGPIHRDQAMGGRPYSRSWTGRRRGSPSSWARHTRSAHPIRCRGTTSSPGRRSRCSGRACSMWCCSAARWSWLAPTSQAASSRCRRVSRA
jgi:hypothetical protein